MKMKHFHSRKLGKCKNYREERKTSPLFHLGKINVKFHIFSLFVIYLFNEFQTYHFEQLELLFLTYSSCFYTYVCVQVHATLKHSAYFSLLDKISWTSLYVLL